MMRDIKFRAWTGEKMVLNETGLVGANGFLEFIVFHTGYQDSYEWLAYKFMQYTGLKDKNGVEIYEGDVLSIPIGIRTEKFIHVIKWEKETASFILEEVEEGNMTWYFDDLPYETGEVIGNIYEHPNLLEDKQ